MTRAGAALAMRVGMAVALAAGALQAADDPERVGPRPPDVAAGAERLRLDVLERSAREFQLGLAAQDQRDLAGAASAYRRALNADPAFVEARVNLARVLLDQGELDQADVELDRALAAHADYPPTYAARGLVALRRGDLARARSELVRALRLDADAVEARVNLAAVLIRQGEFGPARNELERVLALAPEQPEAVFNCALLEDLSGRSVEARYFYAHFLALAGSDTARVQGVEKRLAELSAVAPPARPGSTP